jgi:hypothetical protein
MKNLKTSYPLLLLAFWLFLLPNCSPQKPVTSAKSGENSDYVYLETKSDAERWIDQKVAFRATVCRFENEHLIRPSFDGNEAYICLDNAVFGQILAYHASNFDKKPTEKSEFLVYGRFAKTTGAGKGGGMHTEYFLEMDKAE